MRSDDLKFPFGKYRDQPFFDVVSTSDPSYWVWVLTQPSLWQRYPEALDWIWLNQGRYLHIFEQAVAEAERRGRARQ